jgi:dipeptidase E
MKKILLASNGNFVLNGDYEIADKPKNKIKWAHIITASKGCENKDYISRHTKEMDKLGWNYEEIDIEGKTKNELKEILNDKDAIYVEGGNTFYLLRAIRESGFNEVVKEFIDKGIPYVGTSAGSYVACPTIEMATWKHQDKYDRCGVTDFTGMNLVPFLVTAHYDPEFEQRIREGMSKTHLITRILQDDQAIMCSDDSCVFLGGTETKLAGSY